MEIYPKKKWKKRDSSDAEWMKLGDSSDARRQRADAIEQERRHVLMWVLGIAVLFLFFYYPLIKQEEWLPTYYFNPADLTTYSNGPVVESLEQCRDWINAEAMRRDQESGEYHYECGLNCEFDNQYRLFVCDDTLQ